MRRIILAFASLLAASAANAGPSGGVDNLLSSCAMADDEPTCSMLQSAFRTDWADANKGDYTAERNVASCLSTGCKGAVNVDLAAGCAWRIVVLLANDAFTSEDVGNYSRTCIGQMRDAVPMAQILFRRIYHEDLPDILDLPRLP